MRVHRAVDQGQEGVGGEALGEIGYAEVGHADASLGVMAGEAPDDRRGVREEEAAVGVEHAEGPRRDDEATAHRVSLELAQDPRDLVLRGR